MQTLSATGAYLWIARLGLPCLQTRLLLGLALPGLAWPMLAKQSQAPDTAAVA